MTKKRTHPNDDADPGALPQSLSQRAEAKIRANAPQTPARLSPEEAQPVLHELQVHQIELELQNEELRRMQAELEASRARYFDLYNLAPAGYITLSEPGLILEANVVAAALLGVVRSVLVKQPLTRFIVPEDQDLYYQLHTLLFRTCTRQVGELRLRRADGVSIWVLLEMIAAPDPGGAPMCRVVMSDITARVRSEQERQRAEKIIEDQNTQLQAQNQELQAQQEELTRALRVKDEFLSTMSHELRSPLHAVSSATEVLDDGVYGAVSGLQHQALAIIAESSQHLLALINDILDFSKSESGMLQLALAPVAVEEVCQASLRLVREQAHKKNLRLTSHFDEQVDSLLADERRLKQVLVNLLTNAVKFTPAGGAVGLEVTGDRERQTAHLTVWDSGIGIAAEDLGKLFQPFVQIDSQLSRAYTGTGLGLALVRRLVDMHGGSIAVETQPGQGSRFTVSLPWPGMPGKDIVAPALAETRAPLPVENPPNGIPILLADDNDNDLFSLTAYLRAGGFAVNVARNGREALQLAQAAPPALILMDVQLPDLDGLEATRRLRTLPELAQVPIIALTALAMPGDRERCLAAGADDYLSKPVSMKTVVEAIQRCLAEKQTNARGRITRPSAGTGRPPQETPPKLSRGAE
jgi:PAS domain S-box-containing protein